MGLDPMDHEGRYMGQDIYVLGSGPSLNHLPPRYFSGRVVVSANHGCTKAGIMPAYFVTKYHRHALEYLDWYPQVPVVVTRYEHGATCKGTIDDPRLIVVDHNDNTCERWKPEHWPSKGGFVATWSTITTAMHWAAHLGARSIIMVGHDCGWIDDAGRVPGYREQADNVPDPDGDSFMWETFDRQSRMVKEQLVDRYGCAVVSLNPFINGNLEGHRWHSFAGDLNA